MNFERGSLPLPDPASPPQADPYPEACESGTPHRQSMQALDNLSGGRLIGGPGAQPRLLERLKLLGPEVASEERVRAQLIRPRARYVGPAPSATAGDVAS